jgi:hypothetical protein
MKERGSRRLTLSPHFLRRCAFVCINAQVQVPGAGVYRQIPVQHGDLLRRFSQTDFKHGSLNARTKDNLPPMFLEEFTEQMLKVT